MREMNTNKIDKRVLGEEDEEMGIPLRRRDGDEEGHEDDVLWAVGDASDAGDDDGEGQDDDVDHHLHPLRQNSKGHLPLSQTTSRSRTEEGMGLMQDEDDEDEDDVNPPPRVGGSYYDRDAHERSPTRTQRLR